MCRDLQPEAVLFSDAGPDVRWCSNEPSQVPSIMHLAFWTSREGRRSPVLLDLPLDAQMADIPNDPAKDAPLPIHKTAPDEKQIAQAIDLLLAAERPVLIMGGGVLLAGAARCDCRTYNGRIDGAEHRRHHGIGVV